MSHQDDYKHVQSWWQVPTWLNSTKSQSSEWSHRTDCLRLSWRFKQWRQSVAYGRPYMKIILPVLVLLFFWLLSDRDIWQRLLLCLRSLPAWPVPRQPALISSPNLWHTYSNIYWGEDNSKFFHLYIANMNKNIGNSPPILVSSIK